MENMVKNENVLLTPYSEAGVSIISKIWVFYKSSYWGFEFFINMRNWVFYKKRLFFIKSARFLEFRHFLKVKDWWNKFKTLFRHFLFTVCEHTCTLYKNRSSDTWYDTKITFSKRCEGTCFYPLHFAYKSCLPFRSFL